MTKKSFDLTAAHLRILALFLMLLDHGGLVFFPGKIWMRCLGRLTFPVFAFQTAEGYRHTRNFRRYCLRLAIFALVSEIPFDLMAFGTIFYPAHQNVMFTLLLGLLACRLFDDRRFWALIPVFLAASLLHTDYRLYGVLLVLVFHAVPDRQLLLPFLILLSGFFYGFFSIQMFAVLAWVPIFLYSGERGRGGKGLQYGSYVFYPLHMLILGLFR